MNSDTSDNTWFFEIYTKKDQYGVWGNIEVGHVLNAATYEAAKTKLMIKFHQFEVIDLYRQHLCPLGLGPNERHNIVR